MNRPSVAASSISVRAAACLFALGFTGSLLYGVDALAQQRSVSAYAQVVQFDRVVVVGQRLKASRQAANDDPCELATQRC
ncbi:MAG TPA: hypothetical protein VFR90_01285 [Methylibium sp.]|uniref:hypothetical protein n=1 Tax=Methylibium sp. TaxID=2067992 RepID=UPI002DBFC3FC|nr:hypothetical protein [Methylibium sp.]HEU4457740.1 hypothetical protein [Methylibium sp.]